EERDIRRRAGRLPTFTHRRRWSSPEGRAHKHRGEPVASLFDCQFELLGIEMPRFGFQIRENGLEAAPSDRVDDGSEGEGRNDHLTAMSGGATKQGSESHHQAERRVSDENTSGSLADEGGKSLGKKAMARPGVRKPPLLLRRGEVRPDCVERWKPG